MHTVLIIEDDDSVIYLVERILTSQGYKCISVQSLYEVEERVEEFRAVNLVLADVFFPEGTSIETVKWLSATFPKARVVLMSGYEVEQALGDTPMEEDWVFLQKPFSFKDLVQTVELQLLGVDKGE
jgi:DNA-binding NtrC family response regulator